ncbi:MAG: diguanylate cyclase/phosphodiesterase with sensor [Frankiales bacterium]|nr:diguanylate cyclase/phosphodiesterase with sensor [Frankiales bacterium]
MTVRPPLEDDGARLRQRRTAGHVAAVCGTALLLLLHAALTVGNGPDVPVWQALLVLGLFVGADLPLLHLRFGHNRESFTVGELSLVLGLCLAPGSLLLLLAACGLVLFHLPRRQPVQKRSFNAASLVIGVGLALGTTRVVGLDLEGVLSVRSAVALVLAATVFTLWTGAAVARVISVAQGVGFLEVWRRGLLLRLLVAFGNTALGVLLVAVVQVNRAVLLVVPPLLGLLLMVYRSYLVTMQERDVWQQLEQAGRELNLLEERAVAEAVVTRAARLMNADRVDLVLDPDTVGAVPSVWSGDAEGLRSGGADRTPAEAEMVHTVALSGPQGRLGLLRVAFDGPVALTRRERHVLRTFCHSVGSSLQNVRLYEQMRRHAEAKAHEASHDGLTGLGNRTLLHDRAAAVLGDAAVPGSTALLIVDLDHFKEINDTLGHAAGDVFLREVGERIRGAVPHAEAVCRLGGDEYAVLLTGLDLVGAPAAADLVAAELLQVLAEPVVFDGLRLSVEGSVGVACHPQDAATFEELLQRADVALYQAKTSRGSFAHYRADRDDSSVHRLALAAELRGALTRDELVVHFQPQLDLASGTPIGAEALVRWQHPTRGLLQPAAFVSAVEHSGLIRDFTLDVLGKAVSECASWHRAGRPLSVAVNLSARNLLDRDLPSDVSRVLARAGLAPEHLVLEITETTMMSELDVVEEVLGRLRALGVQLSVDDFGTGYSSLAFLQRVQVNEVKVDRSFVRGLPDSASDRALVRATVQLAHSLGARAVAEGVEDAGQLHELAGLGCDSAQGYHLGRPVPAAQLRADLGIDAVAVDTRRLRAV